MTLIAPLSFIEILQVFLFRRVWNLSFKSVFKRRFLATFVSFFYFDGKAASQIIWGSRFLFEIQYNWTKMAVLEILKGYNTRAPCRSGKYLATNKREKCTFAIKLFPQFSLGLLTWPLFITNLSFQFMQLTCYEAYLHTVADTDCEVTLEKFIICTSVLFLLDDFN